MLQYLIDVFYNNNQVCYVYVLFLFIRFVDLNICKIEYRCFYCIYEINRVKIFQVDLYLRGLEYY